VKDEKITIFRFSFSFNLYHFMLEKRNADSKRQQLGFCLDDGLASADTGTEKFRDHHESLPG
jgi:hypothetical protein